MNQICMVRSMIKIGEEGWQEAVRCFTGQIDPDFWDGFQPVADEEVAWLEKAINRVLPSDFRQFWATFGAGPFPVRFGGGIYSPREVYDACHGPLMMALGSAGWASDDEQRLFYSTRGAINPNPEKFNAAALMLQGVNLLDLVQIGSNGSGRYHQLVVGMGEVSFGYCLLTPERTFESKSKSFSDAFAAILTKFRAT